MAESRGKNLSVIGVLGMFSFLTALSGSSTSLAIPKIAVTMDVSSSAATWVVQTGLITTAILLVMFGHLGDILSKNCVFLAGGSIFVLGAAITGLAPSFVILLFGRVIEAIGSAMIMANSMGIVTQYFPNDRRAEALAMISMFISVGSISGPGIGDFIMSISSWRWIYLFNVPFGLFVLWLGFKFLPIPRETWSNILKVTKGANWTGQNLFTIGIILFFLSGTFFQSGRSGLLMGLGFFVVGGAITIYSFFQDDKANLPWIAPRSDSKLGVYDVNFSADAGHAGKCNFKYPVAILFPKLQWDDAFYQWSDYYVAIRCDAGYDAFYRFPGRSN